MANGTVVGIDEAKLWNMADALRNNMDAAECTSTLAEAFGVLVEPLFKRARMATEQSRTLGGIRDALLPKLISGEIRLLTAQRVQEAALR